MLFSFGSIETGADWVEEFPQFDKSLGRVARTLGAE